MHGEALVQRFVDQPNWRSPQKNKKNITSVLCITKKVYFCRLFEVECKGEWKKRV